MAAIDALAVLSGGIYADGTFVLLAMIGEAAEWLVAGVVLGLFAVLLLAATVVSILRTKSLPKSSRLASLVERLEREYPLLREFDVSEKVEPTTEDRADRLKQQYVDGEIGEREFEREMERLLDDDSDSRSRDYKNIEID